MAEKKCLWCQRVVPESMKYCNKGCRRKARSQRKKTEMELKTNHGKPIVERETKMESVFCACKEFKDTGKGRCSICDKTPNLGTRKKLDEKDSKRAGPSKDVAEEAAQNALNRINKIMSKKL
jgi:hypothetical protein